MNTQTAEVLQDVKVSLKLKLATLWASLMFLIIYIDYFHLFMPGSLQSLSEGKAFVFDITQGFLLATLTSVTIPALMIFLSAALPARINRFVNVLIASLFVPYTLFNLSGTVWMHMLFGAAVEVLLLLLIIRYAWKWPRVEA